jgi:sirohydrochlorin ferrochelatase
VGLLVMAHGGSPEWDAAVQEAMEPLAAELPTKLAFGMARRETLQEAVEQLEEAGVDRIAVVRLFVSGTSFLHRTQFLLGVRDDPPPHWRAGGSAETHAPMPVARRSEIVIEPSGLSEAAEIGSILKQRVGALSRDPTHESVLLLAHGMSTEEANRRLVGRLDGLADSIRSLGPFRSVAVETLREDWPEARARAEQRIRTWVQRANEGGGRAIVVPARLSGFGPYREVLEDLEYAADETGFLPHPIVGDWVRGRAAHLFCENGWPHPLGECRERGQSVDR